MKVVVHRVVHIVFENQSKTAWIERSQNHQPGVWWRLGKDSHLTSLNTDKSDDPHPNVEQIYMSLCDSSTQEREMQLKWTSKYNILSSRCPQKSRMNVHTLKSFELYKEQYWVLWQNSNSITAVFNPILHFVFYDFIFTCQIKAGMPQNIWHPFQKEHTAELSPLKHIAVL